MKTKIRFSDITGMLERDEMKEIIGGCGNSYGSIIVNSNPLGGGGGGLSGFGGGTAIGSTFGGQPYAGYSNPVTNSYYGSSSSGSSGNTSGSTWQSTANGYTTTNATEISRILEFLNGQSNGQSIANFNPNMSQIFTFVAGEMQFTAGGMITLPNGTVWGGELNEVIIYPGGSSTAQTLGAVAFGWDTKTMLSQLAAGGDAAGDLAKYLKYVEGVGYVGLAVGAGITTYDGLSNGWQDYHTAELGTQVMIFAIGMSIPVAGWALGAAYFAADYYTKQNYGEGLYQHLNPN